MKAQYSFGKQMSKEDSDILMDGKCVDKHTFIGMMKFDKEDVIKKRRNSSDSDFDGLSSG